MLRELLLCEAGLSPVEALAAGRRFGLDDRGGIAPGLRADLVLVDGAGEPRKWRLGQQTAWRRLAAALDRYSHEV